MCGVVGYLNFSGQPASGDVVNAMAEMLRHRGPDDGDVFVDGAMAIGHRRLAIVDLTSRGRQPMVDAIQRYVISFNGEVYNYKELRATLMAEGVAFKSDTDTEVVLEGFARWKERVVEKLQGMFAFAIWDKQDRSLFIARDRYGIKPLYVSTNSQCFMFASEVKGFIPFPGYRPEIDLAGLIEYLTFQNFISSKTLFKGVELLSPGTWMRVQSDGRVESSRYWDFQFIEPEQELPTDIYEEELSFLTEQAVNRHLTGDTHINSYLSGGMDSGTVSAIASGSLPDMLTFTVGFEMNSVSGLELAFDEREIAEFMSYKLGTEHYEMVLKAGDMQKCMRDLVWHLEEPRVGQSYPNYYAAKLASRFGKVVLAGTGGDEIFGGYPWRYYTAMESQDFEDFIDRYYVFWQRLIPNKTIHKVFKPVMPEVQHVWSRDLFRDVFGSQQRSVNTPADYVNLSLYFEAKTFLHGLLIVEDKLSMAHSLEARVPFLDNDLVDFAMRIPVREKLTNVGQQGHWVDENALAAKRRERRGVDADGKMLLRRAMKRFLPAEVLEARKRGFSSPDASWFRGESISFVRERLLTKSARLFNYLDYAEVEKLIMEHFSGEANRRLLIWSLLYLEEWLDVFLGQDQQRGRT